MEMTNCPLCNYQPIEAHRATGFMGKYYITCKRCGEYGITEECFIYADQREKLNRIGFILSGLCREITEEGITVENRPEFLTTNLDEYTKNYLVPDVNSVEEKAKKLISFLRKKTSFFGEAIKLEDLETDYPLAYAKNQKEFETLLNLLQEKGYGGVTFTELAGNNYNQSATVIISANGWEFANTLGKKNIKSEQGFVAMWFDPSMKENKEAMEDAIRQSGYKPFCIWGEHFSEKIADKALAGIKESRFIVVDLTGGRNSVFFEAGFAHGLNLDMVFVYRKDQATDKNSSLEFYVRHYQCYGYQNPQDLKEQLKNIIGARIK